MLNLCGAGCVYFRARAQIFFSLDSALDVAHGMKMCARNAGRIYQGRGYL
ncbi:Uncharacterised protein [Chlamydia trachomatis]|nr:Uncharacterised protein [Chlamydia trachomatis]